jgi:hypothetical protein
VKRKKRIEVQQVMDTSAPCPCEFKIVDGHLEADCLTKEDQRLMAELLEKEVVLRVEEINERKEEKEEMPEPKSTEKPIAAVEEIRKFLDELPKDAARGLLTPELTPDEQKSKARYERMTILLKICQLKLSTLSYFGAANEYIDAISEADESVSRALKVVIATQALRDIMNVNGDLELMHLEARQLYKEVGIDLPADKLSTTLDALADLVHKGIGKTDLAKPKEG